MKAKTSMARPNNEFVNPDYLSISPYVVLVVNVCSGADNDDGNKGNSDLSPQDQTKFRPMRSFKGKING